MRKLAGAFYGRLSAYNAALDAGDQAALAAALRRNLLRQDSAYAAELAAFVAALAAAQGARPVAALMEISAWGEPPP
jgi:cytochrome b pre-mRNA-processing protein 3